MHVQFELPSHQLMVGVTFSTAENTNITKICKVSFASDDIINYMALF